MENPDKLPIKRFQIPKLVIKQEWGLWIYHGDVTGVPWHIDWLFNSLLTTTNDIKAPHNCPFFREIHNQKGPAISMMIKFWQTDQSALNSQVVTKITIGLHNRDRQLKKCTMAPASKNPCRDKGSKRQTGVCPYGCPRLAYYWAILPYNIYWHNMILVEMPFHCDKNNGTVFPKSMTSHDID